MYVLYITSLVSLIWCFLSASGAVTNHLSKHHKAQWGAYCENRTKKAAAATKHQKQQKENCEMENSEVRFYDVRSSKGRLPFLNKVNRCGLRVTCQWISAAVMHVSRPYAFLLFRSCLTFPSLRRTGSTATQEHRQPTWASSHRLCWTSSLCLWSITRDFWLTKDWLCRAFKSTHLGGIKIRLKRLILNFDKF